MWLMNDIPVDEEYLKKFVGFVYKITNLQNGKKYIGKKLLKHRRNKKTVESDWKIYYGSNVSLNSDVVLYGKENFKREILHCCRTRSECSYLEAKEQFFNDVLLKPNEYYNDWIMVRTRRSHLLSLTN